ncbi:MAG: hypothetical protein O7B29_14675 [Deltaproteobacteria bacterium]|nr:hypothetical protein [Deltaproteobacteria bacterium]
MTSLELAIEFTDIWKDLDTKQINTMLAQNVSLELLEFFAAYAQEFAEEWLDKNEKADELSRRLPNLLIIGYLIRLLEERVD